MKICLRGSQPIAPNAPTPLAMMYSTRSKSMTHNASPHDLELPSPPLVSGLCGAELLTLLLLLPAVDPSSALRSRNPVHSSASDSLEAGDSVKNSVDKDGVLGVR
jgi:hypothetical protein